MKRLVKALNQKDIKFESSFLGDRYKITANYNGEEIGFIEFMVKQDDPNETVIHIAFFNVNEKYRLTNTAKLIINEFLNFINEKGFKNVSLTADIANPNLLTYLENHYSDVVKELGMELYYENSTPIKMLTHTFWESSKYEIHRGNNQVVLSLTTSKKVLRKKLLSSGMKILKQRLSTKYDTKEFFREMFQGMYLDLQRYIKSDTFIDDNSAKIIVNKMTEGYFNIVSNENQEKYEFTITIDFKFEKSNIEEIFETGQTVKIVTGPWGGRDAEVISHNTNTDIVKVKVNVFGKDIPVEVHITQIER